MGTSLSLEDGLVMVKKSCVFIALVIVFCCVFLLNGCDTTIFLPKTNITIGTWVDDIYTNQWANITFTLPSDCDLIKINAFEFSGQIQDFLFVNIDQSLVISLTYVILSNKTQKEQTAEDYLNTVKQQLAASANKNYIFTDDFENVIIAGEKYVVMPSEFSFKENPTETINYQDGYVRKFDAAFIVLIITYTDDAKESADSFLSSITQIN